MDALFPTHRPPLFSYWEIDRHFAGIDLLIVGSGIVGLTTAIHCKLTDPRMRITLLERGALPSGASTKNAGFACFGSLSELLADMAGQSEDEVFQRVQDRYDGLKLLRGMLGDATIGYEECGGYEIFTNDQELLFGLCMSLLQEANRRLAEMTGLRETYVTAAGTANEMGFKGVARMVLNRAEGAIDTGRMMETLTSKARSMGVDIITGMGVASVEDSGGKVSVVLDNGLMVSAGRVHVATNGFARQLLPDLDVQPARAQVLITSPIPGLRVKGTFHMDEGYYYFRNVGDRLLLGGGRNLDPSNETTAETGVSPLIQTRLENLLNTVILPDTPHAIAHRWSGVMGMGKTKDTILRQVSDRVTCAVRMGGMGVALGSLVGKRSAAMITG